MLLPTQLYIMYGYLALAREVNLKLDPHENLLYKVDVDVQGKNNTLTFFSNNIVRSRDLNTSA